MPTYEELAAALSQVQQWASLAALTLIAVGIYLALAPVGECDECPHCRAERIRRRKSEWWCDVHDRPTHECRDQHRP